MSQASFIDSPLPTALSKVKRMISTVRLADSRLLKPSAQRSPYATGFGSKSMHALDHQSPESAKSGYLMVLDKRKGRSNLSWALEHCVITADAMLASITGNARQPRPFLHLAACSFRMINGNKHTGRGFAKKNIVEVVDRDTNMPLVYLQARTKDETRAWLFELRVHTAYNQQNNDGYVLQDSHYGSSLRLDNAIGNGNSSHFSFIGWGENNDASSSGSKNGKGDADNGRNGDSGSDECLDGAQGSTMQPGHKCPIQPSATPLLASSSSLPPSSGLHKPPLSLVQAAAMRGPSGSLDLARVNPGDRFNSYPLPPHHHASPTLYTPSQDNQQQQRQQRQYLMNKNSAPTAADPAAVSVITAGVLYLQTHMEDKPKPVPHYLHTKGSSRWRPFIGVLARCSDSVGFFLLDADDSSRAASQQQQQQQQQQQVRVVAELDVRLLSTHDTQPLDDSLFGSSFAFSIHVRQVPAGSFNDSMMAYYSNALTEHFGPEIAAKFSGDDDDTNTNTNDSSSVLTRSTMSKGDTSDSSNKLGVCAETVDSNRPLTSAPVADPETFGVQWTTAAGERIHATDRIGNKERSRSLGDLIDFGNAGDIGGLDQIAELDESTESNEQHVGLWSDLNTGQRAKNSHYLPSVLYLSTMRATERSSWVHHLRRFSRSPMLIKQVDPRPQSVVYRIERSLWIGVCEVRGLAQQEVDGEAKPASSTVSAILSLDGSPIACCDVPRVQTNGARRESPTHQFLFGSLPPVRDGMSIVFRTAGEARRSEMSAAAAGGGGLLGYCHIPVPYMRRESTYDGWYPLSYGPVGAIDRRLRPYVALASNVKPTSELLCTANKQKAQHDAAKQHQQTPESAAPSIPFRSGDARIQVRYDELVVLARPLYSGVLEHMFDANPTIVFDIAAGIPRSADWLVETLAKIALATGRFERWIEALVKHELQSLSVRDPALIFRGASVTTRAMDTLMKVCGLSFLDQMIGEIVRAVTDSEHKCEVDPAKLADDESVDDHWEMLTQLLQALWRAIEESKHQCPVEMRRAFYHIRLAIGRFYTEDDKAVDKSAQGNVRYSCVSGFMFLRLLCPAMLSPRSFGLVSQAPSVSSLRTLTLLAKGIQCTANLTDFAQKEPYMQPMNKVIQQSIPKMKSFIDYIASGDVPLQTDGAVDPTAISAAVDGERELAALCVFLSGAQDEIRDLVALATAVYSLPPLPSAQKPFTEAIPRGGIASGPCSPTTALDPTTMESPETPGSSVVAVEPSAAVSSSAGEATAGASAGGGSVRGGQSSSQQLTRPFRKASDGTNVPMRRKASHLMMLDLSYQIPTISLPAMSKRESTKHHQQPPPMKVEAPVIRESSLKSIEELLRLCQVVYNISNLCKQQQ